MDITVPPQNPFHYVETSRLFIYLSDAHSGSFYQEINRIADPSTQRWIFDRNYTISLDWKNIKGSGWKTRPPATALKEVLEEIGSHFRMPDRVFVIGHSRGGYSGADCLIAYPKLSNNYILSAPYFIHPPGNQKEYSLIDIERFPTFLNKMNENPHVRMILQCGSDDYFLNTSLAMMFLCKGSFRENQLQVILDDKDHDNIKFPLFGKIMCRLQMMAFNVEIELKKENVIVEEPPIEYYKALYSPFNNKFQ